MDLRAQRFRWGRTDCWFVISPRFWEEIGCALYKSARPEITYAGPRGEADDREELASLGVQYVADGVRALFA